MKVFIVLSMLVAAAMGAPNSYGVQKTEVRIEKPIPAPVRSSYEAPAPVRVAPAPVSYEAPAPVRVAPVSYEAPARVAAPAAYEAPAYGGEAPAVVRKVIPIVSFSHNNDNQGKYNLDFKTGDSITQVESGSLKDLGHIEGLTQVKTGSYSYVGTDGKTYSINWTADENGFKAEGAHLPTPHPIPEEIRKSLELNRIEEEQQRKVERVESLAVTPVRAADQYY